MSQEISNLKAFYDGFHRDKTIKRLIINPGSFTYRIVLEVLDQYLPEANRIIDIGCGSGELSFYAASKGKTILGIDISSKAINSCERSAYYLGLFSSAVFQCSDFVKDDIGIAQFDLAICIEVIEHLSDDQLAVEKLFELLRPGGVLVLSAPSINAPLHRIRKRLFGRDKFDERVGHLRRYKMKQLVKLIESAGFKIIESKRTEGVLRNFFFVTRMGNGLLPIVRGQIAGIVSRLDSRMIGKFLESQLFVVAGKPL